ncbi:hypothetical protein [Luteitalea sp. TBR-22]|uniref:hypothetical protein n=1 Tax=Luteitalea sp. TBR-22 TaxID=2802971 RepID=UPI001EF65BC7|nr:hypothetical protein [Luteitalea sp. TBR-22]
MERDAISDWSPSPQSGAKVSSFLDGLPQARLREDEMLLNDFQNFPGFELVRKMPHGAAQFSAQGVTLTVVMANRLPLEEQTGADSIYRNETFGSFVVGQYKAMETETGGVRFRLPNAQLETELKRMEDLASRLQKCDADQRLCGFRLASNPFSSNCAHVLRSTPIAKDCSTACIYRLSIGVAWKPTRALVVSVRVAPSHSRMQDVISTTLRSLPW